MLKSVGDVSLQNLFQTCGLSNAELYFERNMLSSDSVANSATQQPWISFN